MKYYFPLLFLLPLGACSSSNGTEPMATVTRTATQDTVAQTPSASKVAPAESRIFISVDSLQKLHDSAWVNVEELAADMVFDIRYATTNNFVGEQMYDCGKCFLRNATAQALLQVHNDLKKQGGFRLKMYDCYRPWSVQNRLWEKLPDARYVHPPSKGSMHNKGAAVDLSIVDSLGNELDMGTPFDYFGKEAYWSYTGHKEPINKNRKLLRSTMEKYGFGTTPTEWWHYSYRKRVFLVSDMRWTCP